MQKFVERVKVTGSGDIKLFFPSFPESYLFSKKNERLSALFSLLGLHRLKCFSNKIIIKVSKFFNIIYGF